MVSIKMSDFEYIPSLQHKEEEKLLHEQRFPTFYVPQTHFIVIILQTPQKYFGVIVSLSRAVIWEVVLRDYKPQQSYFQFLISI
jgi:hypothetical protein